MPFSVNTGVKEVSDKLKSAYGPIMKQKKTGVYYVRLSWYQSVKIKLMPLSEQSTSVSVNVAYTNGLYDVLVVALLFPFIGLFMFFGLPPLVGFVLNIPILVGVIMIPRRLVQPLIQEVVTLITSSQGIPNNPVNG